MRRPELLTRRPPAHVLVLAGLVLAQWATTAVFAMSFAARNGWFFFQGGDQTWLYTTAWAISDGTLPPAYVGYGWSLLLAPVAAFAGPHYLSALPAIVVLQVAILQPAALLCVFAVARRLAGTLFGYAAAAAWIVVPFAIIPLWDPRYHEKYVDQFLPQALGLTGMADYPSLVALLVAAYLVFRALDTGAQIDGALAGLAAGFAIGMKPANGIFVAAPLLALVVARRWRPAGAFAVALLPALLTLAVWKYRGLGHLPAFAALYPEARVAMSASIGIVPSLDRYLSLDWGQLAENEAQLREFFWSVRLLEWLPLAGAVGVARRSRPGAVLLATWLLVFIVAKGTSDRSGVEVGTFFRLLMPAYPAFFLLGVGLVLLVPVLGGRVASLPRPPVRAAGVRVLAAAAVATALVPLIVAAFARPLEEAVMVTDRDAGTIIPVTPSLDLAATPRPDGVELRWAEHAAPASVSYRVLRAPAGADLECHPERPNVPVECWLVMEVVDLTRARRLVVPQDPGEWTYRVGVSASWNDDPREGDILLLSAPVLAAVG